MKTCEFCQADKTGVRFDEKTIADVLPQGPGSMQRAAASEPVIIYAAREERAKTEQAAVQQATPPQGSLLAVPLG